ncbi:MAG: hypothetical protein FWF76_03430 [Oscillospiraceae bacterium]|nr:hypothetical protein [Oscillospiraceae bacterium]
MAVWNQHNKVKIDYKQAETFLSDRAYFRSDFYFIDNYVVHDCLDDEEFEHLLYECEEFDYYMPTKSVIREFENRGYWNDESVIEGQKEMDNFLAEYIKDKRKLEDLQDEVVFSSHRITSNAEIKYMLETNKAPLDDTEFCERFERLYNKLRDNNRIWELRGFTPPTFKEKTGKAVRPFKMPSVKKNVAKKRKK